MRTCFTYASHWNPNVNLGVARIALLNWLHARAHKGKMVLRYVDTARISNVEQVHDFLTWAGIHYDQGPYFTSQSVEDYQIAVERLLASGDAYLDFATHEEIAAEREAWQTKDMPYLYSRQWAAKGADDRVKFEKEGRKSVVRIKMPRKEYVTAYRDMVLEDQRYDLSKQPDHILQRADGTFTEYITTAIDYNKFKIDYVFADYRHLELMPAILYLNGLECLRLKQFVNFAHIAYLTEPDSNRRFTPKRLKRHLKCEAFLQMYEHGCKIVGSFGDNIDQDVFHPALINFYKRSGFVPGAILHYLWASVSELTSPLRGCMPITTNELIADYHITKITKEAVPFEPAQIIRLQKAYMRRLPKREKCWFINGFLRKAGLSAYHTPYYPFYDTHFDDPPLGLMQTVEKLKDELTLGGDIILLTDHFAPDLKRHIGQSERKYPQSPSTNGRANKVTPILDDDVDPSEDKMGTDGQPIYAR